MTKVFMGSDRVGFGLKMMLIRKLVEEGCEVVDVGPFNCRSVHYPRIAAKVARMVAADTDVIGILVCSTGVGMSIAANKIKGARAANCSTIYLAEQSRAHNDANILCLGSTTSTPATAVRIVDKFISTAFSGGKHTIRVRMLNS